MTRTLDTALVPRRAPVVRAVILVLGLVGAATLWPGAPAAPLAQTQPAGPPKLVVILVVDQMRVDYLTWYAPNYSKGLARLTREGAWFTEAAYPYLNTVTCPGHSTIGTGSFRRNASATAFLSARSPAGKTSGWPRQKSR